MRVDVVLHIYVYRSNVVYMYVNAVLHIYVENISLVILTYRNYLPVRFQCPNGFYTTSNNSLACIECPENFRCPYKDQDPIACITGTQVLKATFMILFICFSQIKGKIRFIYCIQCISIL